MNLDKEKLYQNQLSDTWLKASVLGATWAASEIILGSFLHNLHVPFKGNILTAIGLILLITASYKWDNKGLFWRSGLICALMKTMSPSAVIFGPMIAIFAEAILFELSTRLLGKNTIGFMLGAVLAMSWVLFQKVFNLLLFYGFNIVKIYDNLLGFIEKQLHVESDIFWIPLLVLLVVYGVFGIVAVIFGVRIGRKIVIEQKLSDFKTSHSENENQKRAKSEFPHSIIWLVFSFIAIVFSLILISQSRVFIWMPWSIALVVVWVLRYKRGMRQLLRPKFWFSFVIITVLSAMLITSFNGAESTWIDGLWIGIEMNVRAAIVIVGFSVLGTELYNPVIRNFLAKSAYRQVGLALELAFDSLPYVISHLPSAKTFLTQPAAIIQLLINHAEYRFEVIRQKQNGKIFILSGEVADGKTTFMEKLVEALKIEQLTIAGFVSPRILEGIETVGYQVKNVATNECFTLLSINENTELHTSKTIGKFRIDISAQQKAKSILREALGNDSEIIVIDEVGRLELQGGGWCEELKLLAQKNSSCLLLAVRDAFVQDVIETFGFNSAKIINVKDAKVEDVKDQILN